MAKELELFTVDGLGSLFKRGHNHDFKPAPGQTCANCQTVLEGRYCHVCAQDASQHHRTLVHLIVEAFEGLFHLDGRLWRTLPAVFFRPGTLNRDLLEGRIARHVPPLRLFLVSLLLFMFAAEHRIEESTHDANLHGTSDVRAAIDDSFKPDTPIDKNTVNIVVDGPKPSPAKVVTVTDPKTGEVTRTVTHNISLFSMSDADARYVAQKLSTSKLKPEWLKQGAVKALNNKPYFMAQMFTWAHRLAICLLPIVGLSLALVYVFKRKFYIYDHLLVAMSLLSFVFLTNALGLILPRSAGPAYTLGLLIATPVNFFFALKGAYGSSIFGALIKSLLVGLVTLIGFLGLLLSVMFVAMSSMA